MHETHVVYYVLHIAQIVYSNTNDVHDMIYLIYTTCICTKPMLYITPGANSI